MNGDQETGVTTFLLSHEIDTGAILFNEKTPIGTNDTVGDIHDRLMEIGAGLVLKTVDALAEGNYSAVEQDEIQVNELKPAPKIFKDDCRIEWNKPAEEIRNQIRGLSPYPAAWTELEDEAGKSYSMKIYFANFGEPADVRPGTIDSDDKTYLKIATNDKWLKVTDLQLSGKKRMKTEDFLRGFHNASSLKTT